MRSGFGFFLALAGVFALAAPASAHALLRQSEPAGGAVLQTPPDAVTITFTEQPSRRYPRSAWWTGRAGP